MLLRLSVPNPVFVKEAERVLRTLDQIRAETGVEIRLSPEARERLGGDFTLRLSGTSAWDRLSLVASMRGCSVLVDGSGARIVVGRGQSAYEMERDLWASAAAVLARETAIRERFGSPERLAALVLTIPERTPIETIDDLRWALIRAAGGELPLRIPGALAGRAPFEVRREGTVVEILNAAIPADAGLVAVAARGGFELWPPARAENAAAEAATVRRIRDELAEAVLTEIPSPISLKDLAALIGAATDRAVRVERTVVGESVVVLREAPLPRDR